MELHQFLSSAVALVFVLCLIGLVALFVRKYGTGLNFTKVRSAKVRRLNIQEILHVDAKNKLALISRDGVEHLIAFSDSKIELIEKDIQNKTPENINYANEKTT